LIPVLNAGEIISPPSEGGERPSEGGELNKGLKMKALNDLILKFCGASLMVMVPLMTLVIFAQVVMRYLFKNPFVWAEEFSRYLLVWISCLGAAYGVRTGMHIAVQFVYGKFNDRIKIAASLFTHIITLGFFTVCVVWGIRIATAQWDQLSPGLQIPMTWAYLGVPVGFAVMTLFSLELFIDDIKKLFAV